MNPVQDRFEKQLRFVIEIDRVKHVFRKTTLFDSSRFENDAEHAWHLGLMACVFLEHSNASGLDLLKVIKMVLIHDLVEIDGGDTLVYDAAERDRAAERERKTAERIFGILPPDQGSEFLALWEEFESRRTPEAKFAAALDRFEPILQNHVSAYSAWKAHGISADRLHERNEHIREGSEKIWDVVQGIFSEAVKKGLVRRGAPEEGGSGPRGRGSA